jgi:hypothetical protein
MKQNLQAFLLVLLIAGFSSSCHRYYTNSSFDQKTARHKTIAVLPAEMIFTGTRPQNMNDEDVRKVEEIESKAFQQSMHDAVLRQGNVRKYQLMVDVQHYSNTLQILNDNGISLRDSWKKTDEELAKILNVDAVVRLKIQKNRYMSDLASLGIDVGRRIIDIVAPTPAGIFIPNRTNDIITSCSIVSRSETLWNDNYRRGSDWNTPANQVIENITNNYGKHFPYRKKS